MFFLYHDDTFGKLFYRLIHISPSYQTVYRSFEIILEWVLSIGLVFKSNVLCQWFPTREEFLPREEFHEFRGGISTLWLSYLFTVSVVLLFQLTLDPSISYITSHL